MALDLAAAAGLKVPASRLLTIDGRNVLVVERFDRTARGERLRYVSAMTMLEARDGEQRSYLEIAEVIEQVAADATGDLRELWRRIVFSVLISNVDDHLRNHGVLHDRAGVWRLAPAFDLNPDPSPGARQLSTAIGLDDDTASVEVALSVAEFFRLDGAQALAVVAEVRSAVANWPAVAACQGLSPSQIASMEPAFSKGASGR